MLTTTLEQENIEETSNARSIASWAALAGASVSSILSCFSLYSVWDNKKAA